MAKKDATSDREAIPFGALEPPAPSSSRSRSRSRTAVDEDAPKPKRRSTSKKTAKKTSRSTKASGSDDAAGEAEAASPRPARKTRSPRGAEPKETEARTADAPPAEPSSQGSGTDAPEPARTEGGGGGRDAERNGQDGEGGGRRKRWQKRRRGRRRGGDRARDGQRPDQRDGQRDGQRDAQDRSKRPAESRGERQGGGDRQGRGEVKPVTGMLVLEKASHGRLRLLENQLLPRKNDVHVSPRLVQSLGLREGSLIEGVYGRGHGKNKHDLLEVHKVDGKDPKEVRGVASFKSLTSIDPDFHYAIGDGMDDVSMRVVDLICPVGRGQRGLIVAPPRSGKTILLQKFAKGIEQLYPEVHLMVLLVDERPEEATEWRRSVENGQVFVSTNDELHKNHVELCEAVWRRCRRLVELGEDVVLLLDSITRMGRAYNNVFGNSGKTMSGGLDTRALERPKQFFGSARNTETAGSLTILGTTLIETGSVMDKVIFEEFKGTGNMELVLSRKLADRRIFPAIDIEKSGTRKEEKLISSRRLHLITTLRRVLTRMHFAEAMELLITRLEDVEKTDDFLKRFEIDPEAE